MRHAVSLLLSTHARALRAARAQGTWQKAQRSMRWNTTGNASTGSMALEGVRPALERSCARSNGALQLCNLRDLLSTAGLISRIHSLLIIYASGYIAY